MKKMLLPLFIASVTISIYGCKKNDQSGVDNSPSCDLEHSRPVTNTTTYPSGGTTVTYHYDANGRSDSYLYRSADTAFIKLGTGYYSFYFFDSNGDQVQTSQYGDSTLQKSPDADFFYQYDGSHHLIKSYAYSYHPRTLVDSVAFIWQDDNLVEEKDLTGTGNSIFYEYYPGSKGASMYNTPSQAARWLYDPYAHVVLSKNFLKKMVTRNSAGALVDTINYVAQFDQNGRVKVIESGETRQVIAYECY